MLSHLGTVVSEKRSCGGGACHGGAGAFGSAHRMTKITRVLIKQAGPRVSAQKTGANLGHSGSARGRKLQIVLNRYMPQALLFDEKQITKALTRPASWKIPDDYATARRINNKATPIALENTPISNVIRQMARTACGMPANPDKKKGFSLFGRKKDPCPRSEEHTS